MKFYFQDEDGLLCQNDDYFQIVMECENTEQMEVFEAIRIKEPEFFWCYALQSAGEKSEGGCGSMCLQYEPRNGKSGCCKHYSTKMYEPGKQVILKRKESK